MTADSCSPSTYLISFSVANASISGNSVVPGLPNRISTPSCFSRSRKARFPDMTGKEVLRLDWRAQFLTLTRFLAKTLWAEQVAAAAVGGIVRHDPIVEAAGILHQGIDILRQQEAFLHHIGCRRPHPVGVGVAIGVTRRNR